MIQPTSSCSRKCRYSAPAKMIFDGWPIYKSRAINVDPDAPLHGRQGRAPVGPCVQNTENKGIVRGGEILNPDPPRPTQIPRGPGNHLFFISFVFKSTRD